MYCAGESHNRECLDHILKRSKIVPELRKTVDCGYQTVLYLYCRGKLSIELYD